MTPLRAQMVRAMQMRGFSPRTHEAYLAAVRDLARFHHGSPAELSCDEVRAWLEDLVTERDLAPASVRLALNGARFLSVEVLKWEHFEVGTALPRRPERIPELLTRAEVGRILGACPKANYRMMMTLCYGGGLRVCEVLGLEVSDIDGERRLLRIEQGKGAKDRLMGRNSLQSTQRYIHWMPKRCEGDGAFDLLAKLGVEDGGVRIPSGGDGRGARRERRSPSALCAPAP